MSLSLLLEKYDVSTEEGLQKALGDIEKEESEVDEALSGILSRACTLEGRLRAASQAYTKLGEMKSDAQSAADMVDKTASLARDVSAKVRQLDLARSRVAECQRRVHDLIDLQLCSAGVEAAIKAHDYETGAAHVSRFLSMDPGSVAAAQARGAGDPRDGMMKAANTLRENIVRKFEEAARKEDEASIERLFKLFPQIGRAEEGVDLLAKYLAGQAEGNIRRACVVSEVNSEAAVFADAVTRVVEAGGAAVERARIQAKMAPGLLPRAIAFIQPQVCAGVGRVYMELVAARRLGGGGGGAGGTAPASARAAEPVLAELALAHSRLTLYFNFLKRKTEADACTLEEGKQKACAAAVDKIINESDLMRTAQHILAHYLELERYFLEESVNKALKMATPQVGVSTSSLVDDVFFIARKVIRRSLCSGSVDGACAVLNETGAVLERDVCGALRRRLRVPPPDALPLAPPPPPGAAAPRLTPHAPPALALRLNRETEAQRLLYLAHMNEAEAGEEWARRLADEACASAEPLYRSATERDKLQSCAAGLAAAAAGSRAAADAARAGVLASLQHRLAAWADFIAAPAEHPDEMEEDADALPQALDQWMEASKQLVSASTVEAVLHSALQDIASRAHRLMLHYHYTRESGLHVERRARRLAAWAGGAVGGAGRERGARLAGAAALLALEQVEHAPAALTPAARLSHQDVRDLLARRVDFKIEDIKRLKL